MSENNQYDHRSKTTEGFYDFPLDHPNIILNKSIENPDEFKKFMNVIFNHKNSLSDLTGEDGDAMITE